MSKKILVKESGFVKFLQSFFISKAKNKEDEFIDKMHDVSPQVAKMWSNLSNTIDSNVAKEYNWLKSRGYDTSYMDDYIKKNNIKV
jgi:hypothetical protein